MKKTVCYYKKHNYSINVFKYNKGDAGYDLYTTKDIILFPLTLTKVPVNCSIEIPLDCFGLVTSRSGMASKGNIAIPGVIDATYRGQINALMCRIGLLPKKIKAGTRIAQLIILPYKQCNWLCKHYLSETERGGNGFGSTGND